jgi:hypothetical protein
MQGSQTYHVPEGNEIVSHQHKSGVWRADYLTKLIFNSHVNSFRYNAQAKLLTFVKLYKAQNGSSEQRSFAIHNGFTLEVKMKCKEMGRLGEMENRGNTTFLLCRSKNAARMTSIEFTLSNFEAATQ